MSQDEKRAQIEKLLKASTPFKDILKQVGTSPKVVAQVRRELDLAPAPKPAGKAPKRKKREPDPQFSAPIEAEIRIGHGEFTLGELKVRSAVEAASVVDLIRKMTDQVFGIDLEF